MHAGLTQCMTVKETPARIFHVGLMRSLKMQGRALGVSLEIFASCI